ncbi:glycosyltransferase involved in cell wall biosynthesis [Streptosporangium becharense]|uniref:Glycosyltransferase involved in cell wall biosynthesis n=1 Tax=Streptosporangium becharense TaxID=1816182 RepID=A0A7W9IG47_9ACTN|nr:glycosyltransferase [Streptosporangium becharense]MBB2909540.1 glycosyltransferase involved in cell wall biosynthesis [Streptosporangium becharense]MBB5819503.1 glycosyltransferase involved in cell wall biosynthesis [Streptosporangium becharense]
MSGGRTVVFACMDADTLGGIQRVTHTVAQGLAERGHEVHVIGLHRAERPFRYVERPRYAHHVIHRRPVGALSRLAGRREHRALGRLLREVGPGFAVLTSPGVVTRVRSLLPERLLPIGQYHGSYEHARGCWHLRSVRRHYGTLEKAVFLSDDDAWRFSEQALLPNTWSIPNPLPSWPERTADLEAHRVLGVGRLEGVKRFDRLISAFARAHRDTGHDWELHLIGEGAERDRLREHAAACGVAGRVVFRGTVPASEMGREYSAGAVLGLSSEHEGLPLALAEAASHGVPSVAFDVSSGVRSLVAHGRAGLLVPPADVTALAGALGGLMASVPERRRLGAAARAHAEAFRADRVLDRWEELFEQVTR